MDKVKSELKNEVQSAKLMKSNFAMKHWQRMI